MAKIIGNTTATPNPKPDWSQTDATKANYIKNKPFGTEIITTPVGELYADSGELIADGQMYQYNHSLGVIAGETYMATAYVGETMYGQLPVTTFDSSSFGSAISEGVIALCIMKSDGSFDQVVGFDNCIYDNGNLIYSNSHCIIGNMDDAITKIVIEGLEGTYERVIHHKLPNEYVDITVDRTFNPQSLNAQSGAAVEQALDSVTNKFPSSVITQLSTPTTLGDQHIKVSYAGGNSGTHPTSSFYSIYTEGIGLNADLKTTNKDTLVDAINENADAINIINTSIESIDEEKTTLKEVALRLNSNDNIIYSYNKDDGFINMIKPSTQDLDSGEIPQIIYKYLLSRVAENNKDILIATTYDGLAILDIRQYCIYLLTSKGLIKVRDYSTSSVKSNIYKYVYDNKGYEKFVVVYSLDDDCYGFNLIVGDYSSGRSHTRYIFNEDGTVRGYGDQSEYLSFNNGIGGLFSHQYHTYTEQSRNHSNTSTMCVGRYINPNGELATTYGYGINDINATNLRTILTELSVEGKMISRYLDAEGNEQYRVDTKDGVGTYVTSTESTVHSTYSVYNSKLVCLTSAGELIFREASDGYVIKRVSLIDSEIDFTNMENCVTEVYNNTLYIWQGANLFVLDITLDTPVVSKINVEAGYGRMKIIDGTLYLPSIDEDCAITAISLKKPLTYTGTQPDWFQNDPTASTYIQNRPFYSEEVPTDYITLPYSNVNPELGVGTYGKTLGLALGSTYTVDIVTKAGTTTSNLVAMEISDASTGISGAIGLTDDDGFVLYDGMVVDADGNFVAGDGVLYEMGDTTVKAFIHGFDSIETIYHKIPNEYIETDQTYSPTSTNAQSGIAVAEAMKGVDGVKYITNYIDATDLEDGVYIIKSDLGQVYFNSPIINGIIQDDYIYAGTIIVSTYIDTNYKHILASTYNQDGYPIFFETLYDINSKVYESDVTTVYVSKTYVDQQIASLQSQIDELKNSVNGVSELIGGDE